MELALAVALRAMGVMPVRGEAVAPEAIQASSIVRVVAHELDQRVIRL
jgi:hypothetical protein